MLNLHRTSRTGPVVASVGILGRDRAVGVTRTVLALACALTAATTLTAAKPAYAAACTASGVVSVDAPSFSGESAAIAGGRTSAKVVGHSGRGFKVRSVARLQWRVSAVVTVDATYLFCANGTAYTASSGVNATYTHHEAATAVQRRLGRTRTLAKRHTRVAAQNKSRSAAHRAFHAWAAATAENDATAAAQRRAQAGAAEGGSGSSTPTSYALPPSFGNDVRADWITLLNNERTTEGVGPLTYLHYFEPPANDWAAQQLKNWESGGTVVHSGTAVREMNDQACTVTSTASEGIAWFTMDAGESAASVASDLHGIWMNSPEHKATMTSDSFSIATLGYAEDPANGQIMFVARYRAPSCTGLS